MKTVKTITTCLLAIALAACAQQPEEVADTEVAQTSTNAAATESMDTMAKGFEQENGGTMGTPFDVASDPRARYFLLDVKKGEGGNIIATTRREGPSGTSFARREIDCRGNKARYLGEGDTLAVTKRAGYHVGPMGDLVDGSISDVASRFACSHR